MIGALLDEANYSETLTLLRTVKAMAIESRSPQSVCLLLNVDDVYEHCNVLWVPLKDKYS